MPPLRNLPVCIKDLYQIGTVQLLVVLMRLNIFAGSILILASLLGSASAATIPDVTATGPFIQGHAAHSRFLPGSYMPGESLSDDGFGSQTNQSTPNTVGTTQQDPGTVSAVPFPAPRLAARSQTTPDITGDDAGSTEGTRDSGTIGNTDLRSGDPSTHLGSVPLPASLPLFGAAVLLTGALGYARRRRLARSA